MRQIVYRSAITGMFVDKAFAEANPATTIRQEIEVDHQKCTKQSRSSKNLLRLSLQRSSS